MVSESLKKTELTGLNKLAINELNTCSEYCQVICDSWLITEIFVEKPLRQLNPLHWLHLMFNHMKSGNGVKISRLERHPTATSAPIRFYCAIIVEKTVRRRNNPI